MDIKKYLLAVALAVTGTSSATAEPSLSGFIDYGSFSRDRHTGLDWLDVPLTRYQSYDQVVAGSYYAQGWRHATQPELVNLISQRASNAAQNYYSLENRDTAAAFIRQIGLTETSADSTYFRVDGRYDDGNLSSYQGQASVSVGMMGSPYGLWSVSPDSMSTAYAYNGFGTGSFLVRKSTVDADLNSDGRRDIVWQNLSTGDRYVWFMNGLGSQSGVSLGRLPVEWRIAGTGDFNRDGKHDLVWQNIGTGERYIWFMDGAVATGGQSLPTLTTDWNISAIADLDDDGSADLIWENTVTGARYVWFMDGATFKRDSYLAFASPEWAIVATGDFNGDEHIDLVLQNTQTGACWVWFMNKGAYVSGQSLFSLTPEWKIVGAGDFDGDHKPDLMLQNSITGARFIRMMNGAQFRSDESLGIVSLEWSIVK